MHIFHRTHLQKCNKLQITELLPCLVFSSRRSNDRILAILSTILVVTRKQTSRRYLTTWVANTTIMPFHAVESIVLVFIWDTTSRFYGRGIAVAAAVTAYTGWAMVGGEIIFITRSYWYTRIEIINRKLLKTVRHSMFGHWVFCRQWRMIRSIFFRKSVLTHSNAFMIDWLWSLLKILKISFEISQILSFALSKGTLRGTILRPTPLLYELIAAQNEVTRMTDTDWLKFWVR